MTATNADRRAAPMIGIAGVLLSVALVACGAAQPAPTTSAGTSAPPSPTPAPAIMPSDGAASASEGASPAGRFVRVLGIMDCPGGCPSYSVSDALTQPGADLDPGILVEGFLVVEEGVVLFCEALSDSPTPRCAGERLLFEGQGARELLAGAKWSEKLQLLGTVHRAP